MVKLLTTHRSITGAPGDGKVRSSREIGDYWSTEASAGGLETQLGWRSGASHAAQERKNVRTIMVTGKRVDLGLFKGTDLEDLKGLFEGSGKGMRHIKIHKVEDN